MASQENPENIRDMKNVFEKDPGNENRSIKKKNEDARRSELVRRCKCSKWRRNRDVKTMQLMIL
jgi:hypothetical protein